MSSFATNTVFADDNLCPDELIEETVDVMNEALHSTSTQAGDAAGATLADRLSDGRRLRVVVFRARDMAEREAVDITFDDDRVRLEAADSTRPAHGTIKVCEQHLEAVASHPDTFIDDPMKLELVWVKDRMTAREAQS